MFRITPVARALVTASFIAVLLASPASATESTIYPGVGIGKVKLGMTKAQVVHALGTDYIVNARSSSSLELAWNFASWAVTVSANRVVQVAVTVQSQKTASGIGPGSTWRRLVHAYPYGVCTETNLPAKWGLLIEYLVPHGGGTQTIYLLPAQRSVHPTWRVAEVHVRTPFERLPEFGPTWQSHCRKDWRTSDAPI
jgi:hypothetical protein